VISLKTHATLITQSMIVPSKLRIIFHLQVRIPVRISSLDLTMPLQEELWSLSS
jgi:hypothetical protein